MLHKKYENQSRNKIFVTSVAKYGEINEDCGGNVKN